jgi:hypothetical protein
MPASAQNAAALAGSQARMLRRPRIVNSMLQNDACGIARIESSFALRRKRHDRSEWTRGYRCSVRAGGSCGGGSCGRGGTPVEAVG